MAEEAGGASDESSDLAVAAVPEGQGKLVCIQYPGQCFATHHQQSSCCFISLLLKVLLTMWIELSKVLEA